MPRSGREIVIIITGIRRVQRYPMAVLDMKGSLDDTIPANVSNGQGGKPGPHGSTWSTDDCEKTFMRPCAATVTGNRGRGRGGVKKEGRLTRRSCARPPQTTTHRRRTSRAHAPPSTSAKDQRMREW